MAVRAGPRPALIVPDELSWAIWGRDPAQEGLTPARRPQDAVVVLAPTHVPAPLVDELARQLVSIPRRPALVIAAGGPALDGPAPDAVMSAPHAAADEHDHLGDGHDGGHEHHDTGGHEGNDMMAIVGEPGADGLVMEAIELELGPLACGLPGGLVASVSLDGDVVCRCEVRATLHIAAGSGEPFMPSDPLAPFAWGAAAQVAAELARGEAAAPAVQWRRIAGVELERATSHLAWLRSLGRLLGWPELVDRAGHALGLLAPARVPDETGAGRALRDAAVAVQRLAAWLDASRRLGYRLRGRGLVSRGHEALGGVNARAAGGVADARRRDPCYEALGHVPRCRVEGDARARAVLRIQEAADAVELVTAARERAASGVPTPGGAVAFAAAGGATVEGPRGPIRVHRAIGRERPMVLAVGQELDRRTAGATIVGAEWSDAMAILASFDLSPWAVGQ